MEEKNAAKAVSTKKTTYQDDEIDLLEFVRAFWHRLWLILLAALAGGVIAWSYSRYVLTPQYQSTAMLYVLSKDTTLTSLADLQLGSQLTLDYQVLVTSRPVLEEVIEELQLEMTYRQLRSTISVVNPEDTRFLNLTVTNPDPFLAKQIVDKVATTSSDYIGDIMEMVPPKLIEDGEVPLFKSSPNNTKNAILGFLAGAMLVCGIISVEILLNDTICTEEDVTKYLDLTVLASVPMREGEKSEKKENKENKKELKKKVSEKNKKKTSKREKKKPVSGK